MHTVTMRGTGERIAVGKILCLGKNYEKHAREMGGTVPPDPVVFLKPSTALLNDGGEVLIPAISNELHHEVELVVVISDTCRDIGEADALQHVLGYAVGLDMTLRDVQTKAKNRGEPWAIAKGFDTSAPVSTVVSPMFVPDPDNLTLSLRVNGEFRQHGTTADMVLKIPRIISFLSSIYTLERGDCIFTGTPEGVGPAAPGDSLHAIIEGIVELKVKVGKRGGG